MCYYAVSCRRAVIGKPPRRAMLWSKHILLFKNQFSGKNHIFSEVWSSITL